METSFSTTVAEHLLSLFAPGLNGARSALEICWAAETILRDRVAELEPELNSKQAAISPPEESRLVECGPDPLLHVCSFLCIKEKARLRNSSLGLHSMLHGCAIDLTESDEIRKIATTEFVLQRFIHFRMFSNRNRGHETCNCVVARAISGLKVGACLRLAAQHDTANLKAHNLHSVGFGRSWSVVGLSLMQESDAEMLPELLTAIGPNQITKIAINNRSTGILTAISQAVEKGKLKVLQEINFDEEESDDDEGDIYEPGCLGTMSHFGPAFRHLNLCGSNDTLDISGLESCKNLRTLDLSFTHVLDLSPLGLCSSLHTLGLVRTQVTDVSALGLCSSLHTLNLTSSNVSDVSPLGSCSSLHTLYLYNTQVADVSTLGSCSNLHTIILSNTQVTDVSALGSCRNLHTIALRNTRVTDVSALGSCSSLYGLHLAGTQVTDMSALGSFSNLHMLDLSSTQVTDISALGSFSNLHTLDLSSTQVIDVSALGSCSNLHTLDLCRTQVADVSALGSCSNLRTLDLCKTQVADVSALGSFSYLHTLDISSTQVADVSALGSCSNLHTLSLISTQVADVSALGSCSALCKLYLSGSAVMDVSALGPLDGLSIDYSTESPLIELEVQIQGGGSEGGESHRY